MLVANAMIELTDVEAAAATLAGVAHRTPLLRSRRLDAMLGASVVLKAECLQCTGSFKFRGAFAKLASLTADERARGVAAVSSGNHAQAVALAARLHGCRAVVLMPRDAPPAKRAATVEYGAEVIDFDRYAEDRDALLTQLAAERGLTVVHPYDDWTLMAGQGTVALELLDEVDELDALVVPVGGGGLISGCATVMRARLPSARVIGVEPEAGDDVRRSLAAGRRIAVPVPRNIADGQQTPAPGRRPFEVIQERVDVVVTVTDAEIVAAMRLVFDVLKVVVEPSGASALAAVLAGRVEARGTRIGVVLSGGNVTHDRFAALVGGGVRPADCGSAS